MEEFIRTLKKALIKHNDDEVKMLSVTKGNIDRYYDLCDLFTKTDSLRDRLTIITVSIEGGDLFRYPYLDVEWRVMDGDPTIKITGNPANCAAICKLMV